MAIVGESVVEIDLTDFWAFVAKHHPHFEEVMYGVPRVNKSNGTIEIDTAFGTSCHPTDWAKKSKAQQQWEELE